MSTPGNQTQYSRLTGQWSYNLTFTAQGYSLVDLHTAWGNLNVISEPQFQWTQNPTPTPAQYAVSFHLLNMHWPQIGPIVIQTMIDFQYQWTNTAGQVSVVPGIQIAHEKFDFLSIGYSATIGLQDGPNGGLSATVDHGPQGSFFLQGRF
jgi:hypothetical protein